MLIKACEHNTTDISSIFNNADNKFSFLVADGSVLNTKGIKVSLLMFNQVSSPMLLWYTTVQLKGAQHPEKNPLLRIIKRYPETYVTIRQVDKE